MISGITSPIGAVYWYKLTAGPGELVIEMQVAGDGWARISAHAQFVLYDKDMQEVMDELLISPAGTGSKNKSFKGVFFRRPR